MSSKILVYIDQFKGQALPVSWEVVTAGRKLAEQLECKVAAIVLGEKIRDVAQEALKYGVDEVIFADDPVLVDYRPEIYADVMAGSILDASPETVLFPTTGRGRELAAMVAVDLKTGVMPDVIAINVENGDVVVTRPVFGGKVLTKVRCKTKPQVITVRGRTFSSMVVDGSQEGKLTQIPVSLSEADLTTKVKGYVETGGGVSLSDANVIVTGGRGLSTSAALVAPDDLDGEAAKLWKAEQGFKLVHELAELLGAAVGASRAAVDADYIAYEHQVGQTGKIVSPDLYIACGVSGAIQHLAGMRNSKLIVAINEDADAPIFRYSHFGVVGDLHVILPALCEAFRKRLDK
jgi:electron transfer flavoprotein alpha subunit